MLEVAVTTSRRDLIPAIGLDHLDGIADFQFTIFGVEPVVQLSAIAVSANYYQVAVNDVANPVQNNRDFTIPRKKGGPCGPPFREA